MGAAAAAASYTATNNRSFADGPSTSSYFKFNPFSSQPTPNEQPVTENPSGSDPQPGVDVSKRGFDDPEALELAAKALRKINSSPYKNQVFEIMRKQEESRLLELEAEKAHFEALQSLNDIEKQRRWAEEQRDLYQNQAKAKAQTLRLEDELHRKRLQDDNEAQRRNNVELVKMQEVSNLKKESARRANEEKIQAKLLETEIYKAEIKRKTIEQNAIAEADARVHEAKLLADVNRRELLQKANGQKEKWLAVINATFSHIEGGFRVLLTDKTTLLMAVGGTTALAAGIYTTREGSRVTWGYINRILGQPSLIRESSVGKYPWSGIGSRVANKMRYSTAAGKIADAQRKSALKGIVLHPSLRKRIEHLARATSNTKIHQAPFRNMLFYGPPGTGKTMVAKEIARKSGLDYAMMTGGDVAPLGPQAVTKIHEIFDWSKNSKKGLLLFIDEADAFLCQRNSTHMSEAQRSALNALLFRTGDQSRDVVLVLATNRPSDLDTAVTDRIDEVIEFPLPREEERFQLLKLYMSKYLYGEDVKETKWGHLFKKKSSQKITVKDISDEVLREAAKKTEGFSGREIAKLMAGVQASVYGRHDCVLDPELFKEIVDYKVGEHQQRIRLAGEGGPRDVSCRNL